MKIDPRRVSSAWPLLSAIGAAAALLGFLFGMPLVRRAQLRTDLERAVRMFNIGYTPHIALTDFTDFKWTEVYIFSPYTPIEEIAAATGSRRPLLASNRIETDDGISLLVFMDGDRLVRWVEIDRAIADYSDVVGGSPFTPETAIFIMPVEGDSTMVVLQK
jgi:hypothetical protein